MTAWEWEKIKAIFDVALNLEGEQRKKYVSEACADTPEIRTTVEDLLQNFDEAGAFLDLSPPGFAAPVFVPQQIVAGRFRVIRQIAGGGMGEVYEVFDERLGLRVALKTIRTDLAARTDAYERFKREVWIAREVPHEGICRIFELIEHVAPNVEDGKVIPCITMKLLDGHDLQTELHRRRPLPLSEALAIATQTCAALQCLHEHGIIHRDLKPSNIMLVPGPEGERKVVLTDFGLARRREQISLTLGAGDDRPGSPYFQAPELLKGDRETPASDLYALGLVIDEMVTRSPAFTAESIHAIYWQRLREKPIPPSKRSENLPLSWEQAILNCLASDPAERYASPRELLADLQGVGQPTSWRQSRRSWFSAIKRPGASRRKILWWAAIGTATCTGLPTLIWPTAPISILVYAVENDTGNTGLDYVAQGTTGELLRRLGRVEGLKVYPARDATATNSERAVQAQYKLHARLTREENHLRVATQLLELSSNKPQWSYTWQHELPNPLTIELDIAEGVIRSLEAHLRKGTRVFAVSRSLDVPPAATRSNTAHQSYIRGLVLLEDRTVKSALQALTYFRQAVADDPNFALAWAAMADAYRVLMEFDQGQRGELLLQARESAEKAVTTDPSCPEAQATHGAVMQIAWEWERAEAAYKSAISLHPRFARGHRWYGGMLLQFGRFEEGLSRVRLALELDPLDYMSQSAYGFCLFYAGKTLDAMRHLERLLQDKDFLSPHINLGMVYAKLAGGANQPEASEFQRKALREATILGQWEARGRNSLSGSHPFKWSPFVHAITYAYCKRPDLAGPWLDQLEAGRRAGQISSVTVASVHAVLGQHDRALDLLEMAAAYHERELTNVKISPFMLSLRDRPRFRSLLLLMRLPP